MAVKTLEHVEKQIKEYSNVEFKNWFAVGEEVVPQHILFQQFSESTKKYFKLEKFGFYILLQENFGLDLFGKADPDKYGFAYFGYKLKTFKID